MSRLAVSPVNRARLINVTFESEDPQLAAKIPHSRPSMARVVRESLNALRAMTAEVERFQKAIGRPGISAEDIDFELGRALLKIRTGKELKGPHRFDIHKLK